MTKMNSIKETLTKGFVLMALTGTLVSKNPIKFNNDVNIVYAADNLEQDKKDALKELKSVYKTYNKKYYSSKNYKKLTKNYNKGVSLIKNSKNSDKVDEYLKKYTDILNGIKPTVLIKYQNKMEKKLLTTYKKLITKNEYSESNLEKIEDLKEQGVEEIHSALTKTKAKKAKNNYITKLNNIKTKIEQIREDAINFINDNKDIDEENKKVLIEQISNNSEENITAILEEYGYVYEEKEVFDETITVEQIDKKIKELLKKYPKYTEDEVRTLVATANMDFVKDEDILTIFNANSTDEIKEKFKYIDKIFEETAMSIRLEHNGRFDEEDYFTGRYANVKKYKDIIWANDLIIDKTLKKHGDYLCGLLRTYVEKDCTAKELEKMSLIEERSLDSMQAIFTFATWYCYDRYVNYGERPYSYDASIAININDDRLKGSTGYILDKFLYTAFDNYILDYRSNFAIEEDEDDFSVKIDNNYIYEKIDNLSKTKVIR